MAETAYQKLLALSKEMQLISDTGALLGWDQEVLMPPSGVAYRAEQMSWISGVLHEKFTSVEVGDWIGLASEEERGAEEKANLREWAHEYRRATCLPSSLVTAFAETQVLAKSAWAEARSKNDFSLFAPSLSTLIDQCREQAELWGYEEVLYDSLIDKFERGATTSILDSTLGSLRHELIPVVEEATRQNHGSVESKLEAEYPIAQQEAFNREVA